ncbi:hypothetical protein BKA62DRAFT_738440 [Auriculariales sp. MPI-PUGE-AT-0066]|nr:hypothetical protein BKA62DRAFT_738440 [Auriculariales sp. MPI-PUGE-AT-0066]
MSNAPSVVSRLLHTLERLSLPVVTAESCTGGALASALTGRPGAPGLCLGGVTSYSPLFKRAVLGVPASIIRPGGPGEVSAECARAMARGVLERSGLLDRHSHNEFKYGDCCTTTGFLDQLPDGEPTARRGEVWIGCYWVYHEGTRIERLNVDGVHAPPPHEQHCVDQADADRHERKETGRGAGIGNCAEVAQELEQSGKAPSLTKVDKENETVHAEKEAQSLTGSA